MAGVSFWDGALGGLLGVWAAVTVANCYLVAVRPQSRLLHSLGVASLVIPQWNFFAPVPGTADRFVLYRDHDANGNCGPWRSVPAGADEWRPWWSFCWNPRRTVRKALHDIVEGIHFAARMGDDGRTVQLSTAYLQLLLFIDGLSHSATAVATQFVIIARDRSSGDFQTTVISAIHPLSAGSVPARPATLPADEATRPADASVSA